jgi:hypothetical protein
VVACTALGASSTSRSRGSVIRMIIKNTKTRTLNASDVKEIQKSLDELIAEILGLEINQD